MRKLLTLVIILSSACMAGAQCVDWAHTFGGPVSSSANFGFDEVVSHTVLDDSGNVYVAGRITRTAQIGGNSLSNYQGTGGKAFIAKLDNLGTVKWVKLAGTAGTADGHHTTGLCISGNRIFFSGVISGGGLFNASHFDTDTNYNSNYIHRFLSVLDLNGKFVYFKQWDNTMSPYYLFNSIAGDGEGNAYALLRDPWQRRIVKFDSTGQQVWSRLLADSVNNALIGLEPLITYGGGKIAVLGTFSGNTIILDGDTLINQFAPQPGTTSTFYVLMDTAGVIQYKSNLRHPMSTGPYSATLDKDARLAIMFFASSGGNIETKGNVMNVSFNHQSNLFNILLLLDSTLTYVKHHSVQLERNFGFSPPRMGYDKLEKKYYYTIGGREGFLVDTTFALSGSNSFNIFCLDSNLDYQWHRSAIWVGNTATTRNYNTLAHNGQIYLSGQTAGNLAYDTQTLPFAGGATDGFLIKLRRDSTCPVAVNVAPLQPTAAVVIYPNPARHQVHITASSAVQGVRLVNMLGQVVPVVLQEGNVSLQGIKSGTYLLEVTTAEGRSVHRLVVR